MEQFVYLDCLVNVAPHTREIKYTIALSKPVLNKKTLLSSRLDSNLRKTLVICYIWSLTLYGPETWTFWEREHTPEVLKCVAAGGKKLKGAFYV